MVRKADQERKVDVVDVVGFLRSNLLFLLGVTSGFVVVAVVLTLLLPQQYNKRLTLAVVPLQTSLMQALGQAPMSSQQASDLAVGYLQNSDLDRVSVSPTYNFVTQRVEVVLQSRSLEALENADARTVDIVQDGFRAAYAETLGSVLEARIATLERGLEEGQEVLARVEEQIERVPVGSDGEKGVRAEVRLQTLEAERVSRLAGLAEIESDLADLRRDQGAPGQVAPGTVSVEVLAVADVVRARSLVPVVVFSALFGLLVAVVAAIARDALRRVNGLV